MVDFDHPKLCVSQQCEWLGLARSTAYYRAVHDPSYDLLLMRLLDEQYTRRPFYGVRRMTDWLQGQGHPVGDKRVRRLMREMSLCAIYPKPRLSRAAQGHRIYPYLLRGLTIERANQVWCTDITYIRMRHGFVYLVAMMDWFSRYVLTWQVSITLDSEFCLEALEAALDRYGRPEIFNSDQGAQFTSDDFTGRLDEHDVRISMDGRNRVFDNLFIERLWRSVKYEEVYLYDYESVPHAVERLGDYFTFYNHERPHQGLGNATPWAVYSGRD